MPIWLRKFNYYTLAEKIKKENQHIENAKAGKGTDSGKIHRPNINTK